MKAMKMYHLSVSSRKSPEAHRKFGGNIPRNPLDKALFFAHNGLKSGNRERTIFTLERGDLCKEKNLHIICWDEFWKMLD